MGITQLKEKRGIEEFNELFHQYQNKIRIHPHARDRVGQGQRNVFKEEELIRTFTREPARRYGIQDNGAHAAFFRKETGYARIVFGVYPEYIEIITFYIEENLP